MMTTRTTWIVITGLLLANIAGASLYLFLTYRIFSEQSRTAAATAALAAEMKRAETLNQLSDALEKTADDRRKIEGYFVDIKGSAKFLEKLQSFGASAGAPIHLNSVQLDGKNVLRVDFTASGSFRDIYQLSELLEATPYVIETRTLNMAKVNITKTGTDGKGKKEPVGQLWSATYSLRLLSFVNK